MVKNSCICITLKVRLLAAGDELCGGQDSGWSVDSINWTTKYFSPNCCSGFSGDLAENAQFQAYS